MPFPQQAYRICKTPWLLVMYSIFGWSRCDLSHLILEQLFFWRDCEAISFGFHSQKLARSLVEAWRRSVLVDPFNSRAEP